MRAKEKEGRTVFQVRRTTDGCAAIVDVREIDPGRRVLATFQGIGIATCLPAAVDALKCAAYGWQDEVEVPWTLAEEMRGGA